MTNLVPIPSADPVVRRPLDDLRRIIYVPVCLTDVQAFQVLNRKDGAGRKINCAIPYGDAIPSSVSRHSWRSHFSGVRCFYIGYLFCGYDVYPAAPVRRKYDNLFKYRFHTAQRHHVGVHRMLSSCSAKSCRRVGIQHLTVASQSSRRPLRSTPPYS